MGRHPIPLADDVAAAWERLEARGGPESLPPVIRRKDLIPLFPKMYRFDAARRSGVVPGDQFVPGGIWRVNRETFVAWLQSYLSPELSCAYGAAGLSDEEKRYGRTLR